MLNPELEQLITFALQDGVVTDKERAVLMRKARELGADIDEFEMILDAKIVAAQEAAKAAAPKQSSKHGITKKCPGCGAPITGFTTRCAECGFEFKGVEAVQSANELFQQLQALEREKAKELAAHAVQKNQQLQALSERHNSGGFLKQAFANSERQDEEREDLIRTLEKGDAIIERKYLDARINMIKVFTIPNTKEDLMEMLSMAQSNAYDNDGVIGPEEEVWLQKTDQIYQKIIVCAADDKTTLNQATSMIVSLIKRLPSSYKNFTRIPKELRDKINAELKAEKQQKKDEVINVVKTMVLGWRGIMAGVGLLFMIIGMLFEVEFFAAIGFLLFSVGAYLIYKGFKDAKEDPLY